MSSWFVPVSEDRVRKALDETAAAIGFNLRLKHQLDLGNHLATAGPINQAQPVADPTQQAAASLLSTYYDGKLLVGTITDNTSLAYCYRVSFENGMGPLPALYLNDTSGLATGPRRVTTLAVGTEVLVYLHHQENTTAYILAVLPMPTLAANLALMEQITYASRQRVDDAHHLPIRLSEDGALGDWSGGKMLDALMGGEHGWVTETGLRILLDSFMLQVAVDDMCGIFGFYHDQLLRICAYNHQMWTAGYEREALNDQGEYNDVEGWTPYPWEHLGLFAPGDPHREYDADQWQRYQPWYGKFEPRDDHMQAWHRLRQIHGYLGQGGKRLLQTAPPRESTSKHFAFEGSTHSQAVVAPHFAGLFDEFLGLNGRLSMQSAHGFSFVKRIPIISPSRKRKPEQPGGLGDDPDSYKHAGRQGSGPDHKITGDLEAQGPSPAMTRASGVLDLHAYLFNYAGLHPFHYHAKDWDVPEESELDYTDKYSFFVPDVTRLNSQQRLDDSPTVQVKVDERYGVQTFYYNEAGWSILPDGGLVFFNGHGAEIRMVGGDIVLAAPGDIWLKSGRNCITWAGLDAIIRAQKSIDLTATHRDIRAVAGQHMQLLSGNSGDGGTLIENRANQARYDFSQQGEDATASGLMLKSRHTPIVQWGAGLYMRTGGGTEGDEGRVDPGPIVLDAAKGQANIATNSMGLNHFVNRNGTIRHLFGIEDDIDGGNEFSSYQTILGSQTMVGEGLNVVGQVTARDSFVSERGHVITAQAAGGTVDVSPLRDQDLARVIQFMRQADTRQKAGTASTSLTGEILYGTELNIWYDANEAGSDEVIGKADVSLRSVAQYKTTNWSLYEDRWQQLNRLSQQPPAPFWRERPVTWHGQETYPYPGKENFTDSSGHFYEQDLTLVEFTSPGKGRSMDRGAADNLNAEYADPSYGVPVAKPLNDYYRVVCPVDQASPGTSNP